MAISKIKIYQTVLTPARNALVDDLEQYLNSLTPTYSNNAFQYIKLGLDLNIKINDAQNKISGHSLGNYVRIEQDNKVWYYFIMNTDWKSTNAIELKLSIDSINTFKNDLTWSAKTSIQREHEDRFYIQEGSDVLVRRIDPEKEQINSEKILWQSSPVVQTNKDFDWYLIYKTRNDLSVTDISNPIDCFLCANERLKITNSSSVSSKTYTYADFNEGVYYYFNDLDNNNCIVDGHTIGSKVIVPTNITNNNGATVYTRSSRTLRGIVLYRTGNTLYYAYQFDNNIAYWKDSTGDNTVTLSTIGPVQFGSSAIPQTSNLSGRPMHSVNSITIRKGNFFRHSATYYPIPEQAYINATQIMAAYIGQTAVYTNTYADVDRTDSRIVKIIKLPYAPCDINFSNTVYTFPAAWTYSNGLMKLNDASLSTEFENNVGVVDIPELFHEETRTATQLKSISRESKLYHSDFYNFKLVYDSFVREIALERINVSEFDQPPLYWYAANTSLPIKFKPTNTINSKFAFKIDFTKWEDGDYYFGYYDQSFDYEDYLLVSRNNEETIFSNDYVNYIRTGYNYDQKVKEQQAAQTYFLAGVQLAAGVASMVASVYTGGISAAAGISLVTSAITTFASAANSQKQNENAMQTKLANLAAQSTAVAGSDDVDLLSYYNGNRLEVKRYETAKQQQEALYNLFFYCGYAHNVIAKPNITSRYWFNFIQCKPVFNEEGITPYNDYIDDVKARYQAGVTVYHHHNGIGTNWDWEQKYENWEVDFIPPVAFNANMLSNLAVDDEQGFSCYYTGPVALDNNRYYVEFEWYQSGKADGDPDEWGSTRYQSGTYQPNSTIEIPYEGQFQSSRSLLRARIVDAYNKAGTSGWKNKIMTA